MMTGTLRGIGRIGGRTALILLVAALVGGAAYALSLSPASAAIQSALSGGRGGPADAGQAQPAGAPGQQGSATPQASGPRGQRQPNAASGATGQPQAGPPPAGAGNRNQISLARGGPELAENVGVIGLLTIAVVLLQSVQRALRTRRRRPVTTA